MSDHYQEDEFAEIEALLGELTTEDIELVELPEDLWAGIDAAVTSATTTSEPDMFSYDAEAVTAGTVEDRTDSNVVSLDSRRFSRLAPLLAAAAALVVVIGAVGFLNNRSTEPTVLASAELAYDAENFNELGAEAEASVLLVEDDGNNVIKIDRSTLPETADESADLELWLIKPDAAGGVDGLVSLGLIDRDNPGEFAVPDGFDPDIYSVVDISVEPRDGDASHSGQSILRGALSDV